MAWLDTFIEIVFHHCLSEPGNRNIPCVKSRVFQTIWILNSDCWKCMFGLLHSDFEHHSGTSWNILTKSKPKQELGHLGHFSKMLLLQNQNPTSEGEGEMFGAFSMIFARPGLDFVENLKTKVSTKCSLLWHPRVSHFVVKTSRSIH